MPKISIIIPVYNSEEFLKKCLDSVISQTEKDIEIILVDDGSPDESGKICDDYSHNDNRIKVIHKENGGVSTARNAGINEATGEYLGFVDADDWIEPDMYKDLLSAVENQKTDIVMCDASTVYSDGRTEADTISQLSETKAIKSSDIKPQLLMEIAGSTCRCIYKRELIKKYNVIFPEGIKFSEDRIFNIYAMGYSEKISYIKKSYYNRFVNLKSAVNSFHEDYFERYKNAAAEIKTAIEKAWNNDEKLQTAYLSQFIEGSIAAICNYYYKTSTLTEKQKTEKVKILCADKALRDAIEKYGMSDRRYKWLYNRNITALITYAKLANLKHKR